MSKAFRPKPIIIELGSRKVTLRVDYPTDGKNTFPVLMVQVGTTLHAFTRSGPPAWVNKTDAALRQYINQLLGPEYVSRVVIHPKIELRLEMENEHFIMRNGDIMEVFSLKTSRLAEYMDTHDDQVVLAVPVVRELLQIEHVLDDIIARDDVWNSKDLIECLDAHPTVQAQHSMKVTANAINYRMLLRSEDVGLTVNFTTDNTLFNIGRGEIKMHNGNYYYTINGVDGLKLDAYPRPDKAVIEKQAESLIRKLVEFIVSNSAHTVEPV